MLVYVAIIACNVSVYLCYFKKSGAKIREFGITAKRNSFFFEKRRKKASAKATSAAICTF